MGTFQEKNAYGTKLRLGVQWNESSTDGTFTARPVIYRYDAASTSNYAGAYENVFKVWSNGTGTVLEGPNYDVPFGSDTHSGWWVCGQYQSHTVNKTHLAQTLEVWIRTNASFGTYDSDLGYFVTVGQMDFSFTLNVPPKTSYTVAYNANGGSGAPSSQVKWYGETLSLSSTVPKRTGYTFTGWNTKADGTGTNYASGANYTANAAATLYAQWSIITYTVSYNANGGSGTVANQTKNYGQSLTLASSGFTRSYYTLDGWATSASGNIAYNLGASYTSNAALSLYAHWKINAPAAPSGASATRNSDTSASVSWTRGTGANTTYSRIYIERQTDSGSWVSLGYVAGTATSYTDSTITSNHAYVYRVRAWNSTGYSSYSTSGSIYTTPAAPASVTGERSGSGTSVILTVGNDGTNTATGFDVQYRADGSDTWTNATVASSTGTPVTSVTINNMGGSYYFRVRNTRTSPALESAWTESGLVVTITPPNAPTLISPASGAIVGASGSTQSVTFEWQHNPIDGSAQTAAQVRYRKSTVSTWTTETVTTAQTKAITLDEGYSYVWQVRTKGAADDYGDWSNTQSFSVYAPPTVSITSPSGTIVGMPIQYAISYTDDYGVFSSGTISVKLSGNTLYTENLPETATTVGTASNITGTITTNEFLPSSGNTYVFEVTARSSDTLVSTVTASVAVSMGEPYHGTLTIENDPDTGYVSLTVGWDDSTSEVAAEYATVYRVTENGRLLLGDNLDIGAGILDKYAPLNTSYYYEVITHAESTAIAVEDFPNEIETLRWFVYWGNSLAWGRWNPRGGWKLSRPEKKRVHYVGREYPVSYDGTALDEEHSIEFTVVSYDEWHNGFDDLMHDGARGVYKSCDGKVFMADFDVEHTPNYTSPERIGTLSLTITRIDSGEL